LTALLVPQSTFRFLRFWIDEKQQLWCINLTRHTVAGVFLKGITGDSLYGCPPASIGNEGFERVSYQELVARGVSKMDVTSITFREENSIPGQCPVLAPFFFSCWA
jgi:hypothetical protein